MEQYNANHDALTHELNQLTSELAAIAVYDDVSGDWTVRTNDEDQTETDENNQADAAEAADERISIVSELENRYRLLIHALKKFELGTYGVCELSGDKIELERLNINPAARTCTHHMEQESELTQV